MQQQRKYHQIYSQSFMDFSLSYAKFNKIIISFHTQTSFHLLCIYKRNNNKNVEQFLFLPYIWTCSISCMIWPWCRMKMVWIILQYYQNNSSRPFHIVKYVGYTTYVEWDAVCVYLKCVYFHVFYFPCTIRHIRTLIDKIISTSLSIIS